MKRNLMNVGVLSLVLTGMGVAQGTTSPAQGGQQYTQAELKQLVLTAHTPEQYNVLASYYENRQRSYLQLAAEEKQDMDRRSQFTSSISAKYPRPVDSARYLYEYYTLKASETGALAMKYRSQKDQENLAKAH
jgi:hypothetical protein